MARSKFIWIVRNREDGNVLAAFTVKGECVWWLQHISRKWDLKNLSVMRIRDGQQLEQHETGPIYGADVWLDMVTTPPAPEYATA